MRIALVILHADPARGGAERYTVDLATALAARGEHVTLIASSFSHELVGSALRTASPGTEMVSSADRTNEPGRIRGVGALAHHPLPAAQWVGEYAHPTFDTPQSDALASAVPASGSLRRVHLDAKSPTRLGQYNGFLNRLDEHLLAEKYDIVHAMLPVRRCDVYHPHAGIAAEAMAAGHLKHPRPTTQLFSRVATRLNLKRRRFAAIEHGLLTGPRPPIVLCLSEYVKRSLSAHYTLPPSRLATLFNAVDLDKFDSAARPEAGEEVRRRFGISPASIVALMIAQDFARKGLAETITALAATPGDRLVLLVVGKQDPTPYQTLAKKLGVASRVIFAGQTPDPYAFYRAANLFVLPTRHDPCSLVVLEALAMGLPVISTVFNGACEIMTPGEHGFVLSDPADAPALAEGLWKLGDDATRAIMADACSALRQRLAYGRHLDELMRIYREVPRT